MPKSRMHQEEGWSGRAWILALLAAAAWVGLFARSAEAQTIQVPDVVLAQVLGPEAVAAEPARGTSAVERVAHHMHQRFRDQLGRGCEADRASSSRCTSTSTRTKSTSRATTTSPRPRPC